MTEDELFVEFEEMDLIETRAREIASLESDLAFYLRELGLPDTRVVAGDLNEDPLVSVHGMLLTGDEASELIRRLDPKWDGQSCERSWEGLPDSDILNEEEEEVAAEEEPEPEPKKQEPPLIPADSLLNVKEKLALKTIRAVPPPPMNRKEKILTDQALAAVRNSGKDANDPALRRRVIAASIEAMRKKSKVAR